MDWMPADVHWREGFDPGIAMDADGVTRNVDVVVEGAWAVIRDGHTGGWDYFPSDVIRRITT